MEKGQSQISKFPNIHIESLEKLKSYINNTINKIEQLKDEQTISLLNKLKKEVLLYKFPFALIFNEESIINQIIFLSYSSNSKIKDTINLLMIEILKKLSFVEQFYMEFPLFESIKDILNINISFDSLYKKDKYEEIYQQILKIKISLSRYRNKINQFKTEDIIEENELINISNLCNDVNQFVNKVLSPEDLQCCDNYIIEFFNIEKNELLSGRYLLLDFYNESIKKYSLSLQHTKSYLLKHNSQEEEVKENLEIDNYISKNINSSSELNNDNKNQVSSYDLSKRTFFYLNEKLNYEENLEIEFKQYNFPLNSELIYSIQKQVCGFLNAKGGRIYFGINDTSLVIGMFILPKQRDTFRNELFNLTKEFFPSCRHNKIIIQYIPIKNKNNKFESNLFVTKMIIKQGDIGCLYSIKRDSYKSFMRMPGQVVYLSAEEIFKEIEQRVKGNYQYLQVPDENFIDPEPDTFLNNENEGRKEKYLSIEKPNNNINNSPSFKEDEQLLVSPNNVMTEYEFQVFINNIPKYLMEKEFLDLFFQLKYINKIIYTNKKGKCLGYAEFTFDNEKEGYILIDQIKEINLKWNLSISYKIPKKIIKKIKS